MSDSNDSNTMLKGEVSEFSYGGNSKATPPTKPTTVNVYFPSAHDIISALQSDDADVRAIAENIVVQGYKQPLRNQIIPKAGSTESPYPLPTTFAEFLANEAKRAASTGARGEALKVRREGIDAFALYCTGLGLAEEVTSTLKAWLSSSACNGLASQPEATRANIGKLAAKWIGDMSDTDRIKFTKLIEQINEALQGQQVTADAFSIG